MFILTNMLKITKASIKRVQVNKRKFTVCQDHVSTRSIFPFEAWIIDHQHLKDTLHIAL